MSTVHQFVPTLEPGAVGNHTMAVQRALRQNGYVSEIFAEHIHPAMAHSARHYGDYGRTVPANPDDCLLYHMAIGSPVADFVMSRSEVKAVDYHNITPPEWFASWEPDLVHGLAWGRHQLAQLAQHATFAIADSAFNEAELREMGYTNTAVVPILLDGEALEHPVDEERRARLAQDKARGGIDILFVGRLAPNKAQHELVKVLAAYRRLYDPMARLRLVGGASSQRYRDAIEQFSHELGLGDAVEIVGSVNDRELGAYYQGADVFVSMSQHEGFCVPLLEAMHAEVPIVARASAAVPETLGGAGVLLHSGRADRYAAAIHRITTDSALRAALVRAGSRRLADFALPQTTATLIDTIASKLGAARTRTGVVT